MSENLVILLHGVGARGADLAALGMGWQKALPQTRFVAPDAPFAFDQGGAGRQWFSVSGVTAANRAGRVVAARQAFDATLQAILDQTGFSDRLDRVALVGFSQGAIMALDALASGRWPVAAVIGYAGRLATPDPLTPAIAPVLLVHGDADTAIPFTETLSAEARLKAVGVPVRAVIEPGRHHGISPEAAALGAAFLGQLFHPPLIA